MTVSARDDEGSRLLDALRNDLYVAVVSDALDGLGLHDQAMDDRLRPLTPDMRLVGRAHTVLTADVYERPAEPYRLEIEAVDALKPGDVMVAATNGSSRTCFWGELLSTAAVARGATGCAIDGHTRDVLKIIEMGFSRLRHRHPPGGLVVALERHRLRLPDRMWRRPGRTGRCHLW